MGWTEAELQQYREQGFLIRRSLLSADEVAALNGQVPGLLGGDEARDGMHRERERSGAIRQVYLAHRHCPPYRQLARHPSILGPVRRILDNDAYIWHSKLNTKEAFEGTVWLWHTDYGYWQHDGVDPRMLTVMVLLDRATPYNGSMMVVPGSHRWPMLEHHADTETTSYRQWCVTVPALKAHLREEDIVPVTGEPGDAMFFDCNLLHGSGHNMSPLPRRTFLIVYNDSGNKPRPVAEPRPDWVVAREFEVVG